jgi:hypothetical protein
MLNIKEEFYAVAQSHFWLKTAQKPKIKKSVAGAKKANNQHISRRWFK